MQRDVSPLYRSIVAATNHWFEWAVVLGESGTLVTERGDHILFGGTGIVVARTGADSGFRENVLKSVTTNIEMFTGTPDIGKAVSQEISIEMLNPAGDIARMGIIIPYVRACDEERQSEWIQQGVFYVDTRERTNNIDGISFLSIHGYDAMLKAEQYWQDTGRLDWTGGSVDDTDMVQEIADIIGIRVDDRTWDIMNSGYQIPMPTSYTLREILGYIGSMYVGSFVMTDIGELRLVSLLELPPETNHLIDNADGLSIRFGEDLILV